MHLLFLLAALLLAATSVWMVRRRLEVLREGRQARGQVVGHEKHSSDDSISYRAIVTFHDERGTEHRFASNSGWSAPRPNVGTSVTVCYLPDDPQRAYIRNFYHLWFWPLCLAGMAGALVLAAFVRSAAS